MILSVLMVVLVLAIAFRQSSLGLFSALIMAVLTLCCAAGAIGWHEYLAANFLAPYWKPDYSHAIALAAAFGVPLVLLRLLFDRTITRACLLPVMIDRIGGAACGLITGLVMTGVAALALQMVPFGRSIIGYAAVTSYAQGAEGDPPTVDPTSRPGLQNTPSGHVGNNSLWFSPDSAASFVTSMLSTGLFSGENVFYRHNPDFSEWIGRVGAVPSEVSRFTRPGGITVQATPRVDQIYRLTPADQNRSQPAVYEPIEPPPGREFRVVQLQLNEGARDERKSLIFTPRQFRLVGTQADSRILQLYPVALQQADADQPVNRHIHSIVTGRGERPIIDDVFTPRGGGNAVEVAFSVPSGFNPQFIEYKRGARADVSFTADARPADAAAPAAAPAQPSGTGGTAATPPTPTNPSATPAPETTGESETAASDRRTRGPRTRRVGASGNNSFFGDGLPVTMRSYRRLANVSVEGGALANGHVVGKVTEQEGGSDPEIARFQVPADKRLMHLNSNFLDARSGLGRAISQAVGAVQNYHVTDANGNRYTLAGKYAIASADGVEWVEVQYFPDQAGMAGSNQPLAEIKEQHLSGDYTLVLLFLVDPGARITAFSSGSAATAGDDLSSQNLVAPN